MGDEVSASRFTREERQRYREKVQLSLDVFERLLGSGTFDATGESTGLEVELNLVDDAGQPALVNAEVLSRIDDPAYQNELGAYNIELNADPGVLAEIDQLEVSLRASLNAAQEKAQSVGAGIVMVGILPTVMPEHLNSDVWMSPSARYTALNDAIMTARGEDLHLDIHGVERLSAYSTSLAPESACTSVQLHCQVAPSDFAQTWNAAQVLAGPQVALAANAPYFFGRELWRETRIDLFAQATDTRPPELSNQGVRPRVWFGERWITSIFDLFEENVRYFPSLIPEITDEDPVAELDAGRAPQLRELRLHNGTIYRWNRPVYAVVDGQPHLRVENRVLPAGPTVIDTMANAAFFYGAVRSLIHDERPVWSKLSFAAAEDNFFTCARHGLDSAVYWPGVGETQVDELVLRRLLPLAHAGLESAGVSAQIRDRYLGIIEERAKRGVNGASWQVKTVHELEAGGADRASALTGMLQRYIEHMHSNEPVHTW